MATGPTILSIFAAIWALAGLLPRVAYSWLATLALIPTAIIIAMAFRFGRALPPRSEAEGRRIGRLVGLWSGIEGVAIFAGIAIVTYLGHPDLRAAVMCVAVGLHFFPLGRALPRPSLYVAGVLLTALGFAGFVFAGTVSETFIDLAAAVGLWFTALLGLWDMRRTGAGHTKL